VHCTLTDFHRLTSLNAHVADLRAAAERRIRRIFRMHRKSAEKMQRQPPATSHQPPNLVKYSAAEIISAKFRRTAAL